MIYNFIKFSLFKFSLYDWKLIDSIHKKILILLTFRIATFRYVIREHINEPLVGRIRLFPRVVHRTQAQRFLTSIHSHSIARTANIWHSAGTNTRLARKRSTRSTYIQYNFNVWIARVCSTVYCVKESVVRMRNRLYGRTWSRKRKRCARVDRAAAASAGKRVSIGKHD